MKRQLLTILVGVFLLGADAPREDNKDHKQIQGTWRLVSTEKDGKELKVETTQIIKIDKISFFSPDRKQSFYVLYELDSTKNPKSIDLKHEMSTQTSLGIYSLDGDTLRICAAAPGVERPKEFKTKSGSKLSLMILKREKP